MFTIGCDPEIFVKRNGVPFAATGLVDGNKESPLPVKNGAVQVDGLALEINTTPTIYSNFEEFNVKITSVIAQLRDMVKAKDKNLTFCLDSYLDFPREYYDALPESAKELGCDPDFDAYRNGEENPRPDQDSNRRVAAGHLHIGWGDNIPVEHPEHIENCCRLVKLLDRSVGMASIIINPDVTRREHYGKAGAFRPKSYGVEYRTPDNTWLSSKQNRRFIWYWLYQTLNVMGNEKNLERMMTSASDSHVQNLINNRDLPKETRVVEARNVLSKSFGVGTPYTTPESLARGY